jgi:hypothetical protein
LRDGAAATGIVSFDLKMVEFSDVAVSFFGCEVAVSNPPAEGVHLALEYSTEWALHCWG